MGKCQASVFLACATLAATMLVGCERPVAELESAVATDLPTLVAAHESQDIEAPPTLDAIVEHEPRLDEQPSDELAQVSAHAFNKVAESDAFFDKGVIPELRIRLTPKEEQQLRADQRRYVDCSLTEDGKTTYKKVKMKLKGAAGSFRNLDDRPAITLKMAKKGERFHGLDKFHLNNSVPRRVVYVSEYIAAQICREAGCPGDARHARPRVAQRSRPWLLRAEGRLRRVVSRAAISRTPGATSTTAAFAKTSTRCSRKIPATASLTTAI